MTVRLFKHLVIGLAVTLSVNSHALKLNARHAIVVSDQAGTVLLEKNADVPVPIASLTKLLTAMVVLDSKPDMNEKILIGATDKDALKHSLSHVPVGTTLTRRDVLQLALMSSDNRAAAALARTYRGGYPAFTIAMQDKIKAIGMTQTVIKEPTGLSPENRSSAADLAKMALAASRYAEIVNITTTNARMVRLNGRSVTFHNTNHLVGAKGWAILLSKTGFTNEAGHCLIMRIRQAGHNVTLVLLNANAGPSTRSDALNIRRWVSHPVPSGPRRPTV